MKQEQQKQNIIDIMKGDEQLGMYDETFEEAAVINYKKLYEGEPLTQDVPIDAFKQGVRWQQERSYSEEEVLDILKELEIECVINPRRIEIREWFKQFKNK